MKNLIIKTNPSTGSFDTIQGEIDPKKVYTLNNGRYFGMHSDFWVDKAVNKKCGSEPKIITGQEIINY